MLPAGILLVSASVAPALARRRGAATVLGLGLAVVAGGLAVIGAAPARAGYLPIGLGPVPDRCRDGLHHANGRGRRAGFGGAERRRGWFGRQQHAPPGRRLGWSGPPRQHPADDLPSRPRPPGRRPRRCGPGGPAVPVRRRRSYVPVEQLCPWPLVRLSAPRHLCERVLDRSGRRVWRRPPFGVDRRRRHLRTGRRTRHVVRPHTAARDRVAGSRPGSPHPAGSSTTWPRSTPRTGRRAGATP